MKNNEVAQANKNTVLIMIDKCINIVLIQESIIKSSRCILEKKEKLSNNIRKSKNCL